MTDYDLGTAHGKIIIESENKGNKEALASIAATRAALHGLSRDMSSATNSTQDMSLAMSAMARSAAAMKTSVASAGGILGRFASDIQKTHSAIKGVAEYLFDVDLGMRNMTRTTLKGVVALNRFHRAAAVPIANINAYGDMATKIGEVAKASAGATGHIDGWNRLGRSIVSVTKQIPATADAVQKNTMAVWEFYQAFKGNPKQNFIGAELEAIRLKAIQIDKQVKGLQNTFKGLGALAKSFGASMDGIRGSVIEGIASQLNKVQTAMVGAKNAAVGLGREIGSVANSVRGMAAVGLDNFAAGMRTKILAIGDLLESTIHNSLLMMADGVERLGSVVAGGAFASKFRAMSHVLDDMAISVMGLGRVIATNIIGRFGAAGTAIRGFSAAAGSEVGKLGGLFNKIKGTAIFALGPLLAQNMDRVKGVLSAAGVQVDALEAKFKKFGASAGRGLAGVGKSASGIATALWGFNMFLAGRHDVERMSKVMQTFLAGIGFGAGILKAFGSAILGVGNAIKQMSGIVNILPAALLTLAAAAGGAVLAVKGLKNAFTAGMSEPDKFAAALEKVPTALKPLAQAVQNNRKVLKALSDDVSNVAFSNMGPALAKMVNDYVPIVRKGLLQVGREFGSVADSIIKLSQTAQTKANFATIFGNASKVVGNFGRALQPALNTFFAMGAAGSTMLARWSVGMQGAAAKFERFMTGAINDGRFEAWINSAIQGFKDFGSAIKNLGGGLGQIFRAFGADGENALERFAGAMERFRNAMSSSAQDGQLRSWGETFQNVAEHGRALFEALVEKLGEIAIQAQPAIETMSQVFSEHTITLIKVFGTAIEGIAWAMSKIPGPAILVASLVLSIATAFKVLSYAFLPIKASFLMLTGTVGGLIGLRNASVGLSATLGNLGKALSAKNTATLQSIRTDAAAAATTLESAKAHATNTAAIAEGLAIQRADLQAQIARLQARRTLIVADAASTQSEMRRIALTAQAAAITQTLALSEARLAGITTDLTAANTVAATAAQRLAAAQAKATAAANALGIANTAAGRAIVGAAGASVIFGRTASAAFVAVGAAARALGTAMTFIMGPWGLALAAVAYAIYKVVDGGNDLRRSNESNAKAFDLASSAAQRYGKALRDSAGQNDQDFKSDTSKYIADWRSSLEQAAKDAPGLWASIVDQTGVVAKAVGWAFGGQDPVGSGDNQAPDTTGSGQSSEGHTNKFLRDSDAGRKAQSITHAFKQVGVENEDMAAAITGSDQAFQSLMNSFEGAKNSNKISAADFGNVSDALKKQRDAFLDAKRVFDSQPAGFAQMEAGLRKIANAGDDADKKLAGIKQTLDGMFGSTDRFTTATAAIQAITSATDDWNQKLSGVPTGYNAIFDAQGKVLNPANSQAVEAISGGLTSMASELAKVAANGSAADLKAVWDRMQPSLETLRGKLGLTKDEMANLLQQFHLVPATIQTILKVKDEASAVIVAATEELKRVPAGQSINLDITNQDVIKKLQEAGFAIKSIIDQTGKPIGIQIQGNPDAVKNLAPDIQKMLDTGKPLEVSVKAKVVPGPLPTVNAKDVPAAPTPVQAPVQAAQTPAQTPAEQVKVPDQTPKVTVDPQSVQQSVEQVNKIVDATKKIEDKKATIDVQVKSNISDLPGLARDLAAIAKATKIEVDTSSLDNIAQKMGEAKAAVIAAVDEMKPKLAELANAFTSMVNACVTAMDSVGAKGRGAKLAEDFAAGIESGQIRVKTAAETIAAAAAGALPNSPAKWGPLSGQGYTRIRGQKTAEDYAAGIEDRIGLVKTAGIKTAGAAAPTQSELPAAIAQLLQTGQFNEAVLRKYDIGPTSDLASAIVQAGKKGVTQSELEKFWMTGNFEQSGLGNRGLKPSDELVNQLREGRSNDKLLKDLIDKNNGKLLDPKEEFKKAFDAWNATKEATQPLKNAFGDAMDAIRGFLGRPSRGLSKNLPGSTTKYSVDDSISDIKVGQNLRDRATANISKNNEIGKSVADASSSLSNANDALSKNASDIAEAQRKIADFKPTGKADEDTKSMDALNKSLKDLQEQTDKLKKSQADAQNGYSTAIQNFQQNGGQTGQIPQLTDAKKKEQDTLDALTAAQKARNEFKPGDKASDNTTKVAELDKAISDARNAYDQAKAASARIAVDMKTIVTPSLGGAGLPGSAGAGVNTGQIGSYGLANGSTEMPQWLKDLGAKYGVTPSTYANHQTTVTGDGGEAYGYVPNPQRLNRGVDWNGTPAARLAFAKALEGIQSNALEQIIYMDPATGEKIGRAGTKKVGPGTADSGYYAKDWAGHADHVHTRFNAPVAWNGQNVPQPTQTPTQTQTTTATTTPQQGKPTTTTAGVRPISDFWDMVAQKESGGNWSNADTGGNGHYGGLQFSPETWAAFGGKEFADMPHLATKAQQIEIANRTAFQGYKGTKPQGLGAWEVITNGSLASSGITVDSKPTLDQIATNTGATATGVSQLGSAPAANTIESLTAGDPTLKGLLDQAGSASVSRQDTIPLLNKLDEYIKAHPDQKAIIEAQRDQIMQDKGINKDDGKLDTGPIDEAVGFVGKVNNLASGVISLAKTPIDLYNQANSAMDESSKMFEMLVRGFSGTEDVNNAIDQAQSTFNAFFSIFETITGVVDKVSNIVTTFADIAKTIAEVANAGAEVVSSISEIASVVGSIAGVVSGITGAISGAVQAFNAAIDLGQEAWSIASRYIGKALNWFAGLGSDYQGQVKALYDANDQTLKMWGSDNPNMKTSYSVNPFAPNAKFKDQSTTDDMQGRNGDTYNIYANPNAPASEIIREQMYAVAAANAGAYQE